MTRSKALGRVRAGEDHPVWQRHEGAPAAAAAPGLAREALSADLEGSRTLNADSTRELLARLEAEGLIRGDATLDLTADGETLHRSLRDYIAGPTAQLLSQFDVNDIETTVRTCRRSPRGRRRS